MTIGEFDREVITLWLNGMSQVDISRKMGVNADRINASVARYREHGEKAFDNKRCLNGHSRKLEDGQKEKVIELWQQGYKYKRIAEMTGISHGAVGNIICAYKDMSKAEESTVDAHAFGDRIRELKRTINLGDVYFVPEFDEYEPMTVDRIYKNFVTLVGFNGKKKSLQYGDLVKLM